MEASSRLSGDGVEGSALYTKYIATEEFQTTLAGENVTFLSGPQPSTTKESNTYSSHTPLDHSDADAGLPSISITMETDHALPSSVLTSTTSTSSSLSTSGSSSVSTLGSTQSDSTNSLHGVSVFGIWCWPLCDIHIFVETPLH